jgi:hypothetical protein
MKAIITSTYDDKGLNCGERFTEEEIPVNELPQRLLELALKASEYKHNQEVVISFPNDDTETMRIEVYNGYRE